MNRTLMYDSDDDIQLYAPFPPRVCKQKAFDYLSPPPLRKQTAFDYSSPPPLCKQKAFKNQDYIEDNETELDFDFPIFRNMTNNENYEDNKNNEDNEDNEDNYTSMPLITKTTSLP